jgi:hypothetical protein
LPSGKIVEPTIFTTPLAELNSEAVPKPWHGEPNAAIQRAIMALGSMRVDAIPRQILDELRESCKGFIVGRLMLRLQVQRVVADRQSVNARRGEEEEERRKGTGKGNRLLWQVRLFGIQQHLNHVS